MTDPDYDDVKHTSSTRDAYDRLAPVWSATTDDGPFNGGLERPALRTLIPRPLTGSTVLDAGCGSGAQCAWLLDQGADVIGVDLSPRMVEAAAERCGGRGWFEVADLAEPLPVPPGSLDGITSSLALHYLRDWSTVLASFATVLRPAGWVVLSLEPVRFPTGRTRWWVLRHGAGHRHVAQVRCRSHSAVLATAAGSHRQRLR